MTNNEIDDLFGIHQKAKATFKWKLTTTKYFCLSCLFTLPFMNHETMKHVIAYVSAPQTRWIFLYTQKHPFIHHWHCPPVGKRSRHHNLDNQLPRPMEHHELSQLRDQTCSMPNYLGG